MSGDESGRKSIFELDAERWAIAAEQDRWNAAWLPLKATEFEEFWETPSIVGSLQALVGELRDRGLDYLLPRLHADLLAKSRGEPAYRDAAACAELLIEVTNGTADQDYLNLVTIPSEDRLQGASWETLECELLTMAAEDADDTAHELSADTVESDPTTPAPAAVKYTDPKMMERDRFIYENRKAGKRNQEVIELVEKKSHSEDWEAISTARGIRDAVKRYCLITGSPLPPGDKGGRPGRKTGK